MNININASNIQVKQKNNNETGSSSIFIYISILTQFNVFVCYYKNSLNDKFGISTLLKISLKTKSKRG